MDMDKESKPESAPKPLDKTAFWTTLPGIFTGSAAAIGAITALITTLHQVGVMGNKPNPPAPTVTPASTSPSVATPVSDSTATPSSSTLVTPVVDGAPDPEVAKSKKKGQGERSKR